MSTRSPSLSLPSSRASVRQIGTEAAEVLPYRCRLVKTSAGSMPSFFVVASMIRRFVGLMWNEKIYVVYPSPTFLQKARG
jgi:hypothetical protein